MKTTDFAHCLSTFLTMYLPGQLGLSENTVMAYRDAFKLFLTYAETQRHLVPEKITLQDISEKLVNSFLAWLVEERGCTAATCNQRLTALRTFAVYARTQYPEYLFEAQKIIDIRAKKTPKPVLEYLSPDDVGCILRQPDTSTEFGRRDTLLLSLMYDSAARVQEICDLRIRDIRLKKPSTVTLTGKGRKTRFVPLMSSTSSILSTYLTENNFLLPERADQPLFQNHRHEKLTRAGVAYILKKYSDTARNEIPSLPKKISPHILRHSKAMHMLQAVSTPI